MKQKALFFPRLFLILLAIADSIYLLFIENGYASCSVLGKTTCITILPVYSQHLYVPLPILGIIGYSLLLGITLLALKNSKFIFLRRIGAFSASLFSFYLMPYMIFIVHNLCPFCVISFLLISGFAFLEFVEFTKKNIIRLSVIFSLLIIIVITGVYLYSMKYQPRKVFAEKSEEFLGKYEALDLDYKKAFSESEKPLLIYIYSPQCEYCQYYVSEVLSSSEITKVLDSYSFYVHNSLLYNGFFKTMETKINSVPALVVWSKTGKIEILTGMRRKSVVLDFLQHGYSNKGVD